MQSEEQAHNVSAEVGAIAEPLPHHVGAAPFVQTSTPVPRRRLTTREVARRRRQRLLELLQHLPSRQRASKQRVYWLPLAYKGRSSALRPPSCHALTARRAEGINPRRYKEPMEALHRLVSGPLRRSESSEAFARVRSLFLWSKDDRCRAIRFGQPLHPIPRAGGVC